MTPGSKKSNLTANRPAVSYLVALGPCSSSRVKEKKKKRKDNPAPVSVGVFFISPHRLIVSDTRWIMSVNSRRIKQRLTLIQRRALV